MPLQIPKQHIPGIVKIKQLPAEAERKMVAALSAEPPIPDTEDAVNLIADRVPEISKDDLQVVVDTLYVLYYVREFSEVGLNRFVNDLIQTLKTSKDSALAIAPEDADRVKDRFKNLLSIENVSMISKGLKLQRNGEHLYCEARIMSDIRPVFHEDVSIRPAGAVVSHTLKLGYHKGGEHEEFFIVLESADLKALKQTVERAIAKESTLRQLMADSGLEDLGA